MSFNDPLDSVHDGYLIHPIAARGRIVTESRPEFSKSNRTASKVNYVDRFSDN